MQSYVFVLYTLQYKLYIINIDRNRSQYIIYEESYIGNMNVYDVDCLSCHNTITLSL